MHDHLSIGNRLNHFFQCLVSCGIQLLLRKSLNKCILLRILKNELMVLINTLFVIDKAIPSHELVDGIETISLVLLSAFLQTLVDS